MNPEFHINTSIKLYSNVFNNHQSDGCSRNIVRQLELQNLAWINEDSLKIVRAQCTGDQKPSVIRAFYVLFHLSETGMVVPDLMAQMAAQCFHFSQAFVTELVDANNQQLREGSIPAIWAVVFILHRHSLAQSAKSIAEELESYWFEFSETLVEGIINVQRDRNLMLEQES